VPTLFLGDLLEHLIQLCLEVIILADLEVAGSLQLIRIVWFLQRFGIVKVSFTK